MHVCALLLLNVVLAAPRVPEALLFGQPTPEQRLLLTPSLATTSGEYRCELVEVDRHRGESGSWLRLFVRCTGATGAALPAELAVVDTPLATDSFGRELSIRTETVFRQGAEAWLVFVVHGEAKSLAVLSAAVGPAPPVSQRHERLPLEPLATPHALPAVDAAVEPTLLRRERALLDVTPDGPPYYFGLDSSLGSTDPPPAKPASPFVTLRLHVLAPPAGEEAWRLVNLRLTGAGGEVFDDWRHVRRLWRPDWGGWLGVTGSDGAGGVTVDAVEPGGPAAQAGLRRGDRLTALDGQPVTDAYSLGDAVRRRAARSSVRLTLARDGRETNATVRLGSQSLWPDRGDAEFAGAWTRLAPLRAGARGDVLTAWDWQSRLPAAAGFEPRGLELVFARSEPAAGTTFVFRRVPLSAAR